MSRPLYAMIDSRAMATNLKKVKQLSDGALVMATVKADAYGHGLECSTRAMEDADGFAVSFPEEGTRLRSIVPNKPIILLEGFFDIDDLASIAEFQLQPVIHTDEQIRMVLSSKNFRCDAWLKINTGMHRLGFPSNRILSIFDEFTSCETSVRIVGIMSHLACADDLQSDMTNVQLDRLRWLMTEIRKRTGRIKVSIANSAAILSWPAARRGWLRPGIMLYGAAPFPGGVGKQYGLTPAMTLVSKLISIQWCTAGEHVGYGGDWLCPVDMPIGIVAVGYGDGYPRHAPAGTPVLINGRQAGLVGRVSMDMLAVDLRGHQARLGDSVILWGPLLPVELIADCASTIPNDLLAGVSPRVPRIVVDG